MNNTIKRLSDHASASAKVRINTDENGIIRSIDLISYTTRVCTIEFRPDGRYIECTGTYSRTTSKHIGLNVAHVATCLNSLLGCERPNGSPFGVRKLKFD